MITIYQDKTIRRYNLLAYIIGYLIGVIIVASVVSFHVIDRQVELVLTTVVMGIVSLLLPPIFAPGG